ncbi:hypothetical protein [Azospirillum picis]|uniref:Flagellar hook protein FlgE n=1 Tax=Azospirillum picis TaxID=488438 RepID=A0ABU0MS20_9PROT|nr:hypothetical protein [Azospirillum picis]MBP2302327.1 hypothetical protein [Azospirillum picis]MDQ0535906.1 hypothetical protein [Azospirillum picis]
MAIGPVASPTLFPTGAPGDAQASALEGLRTSQARADDASERIASGDLDPAVVLDLSSAQVGFAANAKVLQATQENSKRLLDLLA